MVDKISHRKLKIEQYEPNYYVQRIIDKEMF